MSKVWHGETEKDWADVLLDEVVRKGGKALVHCGAHHSFTQYRQPIVRQGRFLRFGDLRFGNYLFEAIGERAVNVCLHRPWVSAAGFDAPAVFPADGYIDAIMKVVEPHLRRSGFDTQGTPLGDLPGETSLYSYGYDNFTLSTICDGCIYDRPFEEFEAVTPVEGFVTTATLAYARRQSSEPSLRDGTVEDFFALMERYVQSTLDHLPRCSE